MPLFKLKNLFKTKSKSDKIDIKNKKDNLDVSDEQNKDNQINDDDDNTKLYKVQTMRDLVHKNNVDQIRNCHVTR